MTERSGGVALEAGDRVLITRLEHLGDVIISTVLIDAVRERWPGVEIDYLARRSAADILEGDERLARVHALERHASVVDSLGLVAELRRRRFRASIDLYSNPRSAWLCFAAGAPVRIGGNRRGRRRLYTHPVTTPPPSRAATAFHLHHGVALDVSQAPRQPRLRPTDAERAHARRRLEDAGVGGGAAVIGVHPGGKWTVKRWPTDSFANLCRLLVDGGHRVVVLTGPGEAHHTDELCARVRVPVTRLDAMPVRDAMAVVTLLDAMVVSDGGMMHLSVAVGTPTVGVFGSAEPEIWFPYEHLGPYRAASIPIDCRPCHRHECPLGHTDCLHKLSPEHVLARVEETLSLSAQEKARG